MADYLPNKLFQETIDLYLSLQRKHQRSELILSDKAETHQRKLDRDDTYDGAEFDELVIAHQKLTLEYSRVKDTLSGQFYLLATKVVTTFRFGFIDEDDAIQEAVIICFDKVGKFNPDRGRAFNYMTTVIVNHLRQLWRAAKNYHNLVPGRLEDSS